MSSKQGYMSVSDCQQSKFRKSKISLKHLHTEISETWVWRGCVRNNQRAKFYVENFSEKKNTPLNFKIGGKKKKVKKQSIHSNQTLTSILFD